MQSTDHISRKTSAKVARSPSKLSLVSSNGNGSISHTKTSTKKSLSASCLTSNQQTQSPQPQSQPQETNDDENALWSVSVHGMLMMGSIYPMGWERYAVGYRSEGNVCVAASSFVEVEEDVHTLMTEGTRGVRIQVVPYTTNGNNSNNSDNSSSSSSSSSFMHQSIGLGLGPGLGPGLELSAYPGLSAMHGALNELTTDHASQPSMMWIDVDVAAGASGMGKEGGTGTDPNMSREVGDDVAVGGTTDHRMSEHSNHGRVGDGYDHNGDSNGDDVDSIRLPLSVMDQALGQLYDAAESNTIMMVITQADIAPLTQVSTHLITHPINSLSQPTSQHFPINPPYEHSASEHPLSRFPLSTQPISHPLSTLSLVTPHSSPPIAPVVESTTTISMGNTSRPTSQQRCR